MNERTKKQIVGLFMSFVITLSSIPVAQAQSKLFVERSIVGVWLGQLQRRDCSNNDPIGPPSPGIISFQKGGTASSSSTLPAPPQPLPAPFLQTAGHGVWEQLNAFEYKAAIVLMKLNSDGTFGNYTMLRGSIDLSNSGNEFLWVGTGQFVAADGTILLNTCNTISGTRFE